MRKAAVVDLEQAILQTDLAQQRIRDFEVSEAFAEDRAEFDKFKPNLTSWRKTSSEIRRL